jgi:ATP-dependent Zn protease
MSELRRTAYHESGHCLAGMLGERRVTHVTIAPHDRQLLGETEHRSVRGEVNPQAVAAILAGGSPAERHRLAQLCTSRARVSLAGPAAEDVHLGRGMTMNDGGQATDYASARSLVRMSGAPDPARGLRSAYRDARRFVLAHREHLDALATELLRRRTMGLFEVRRALRGLPPVRWPVD